MQRKRYAAILGIGFAAALNAVAAAGTSDVLGRLVAIGAIERDDRARLEAGAPVVTIVPAEGRDLEVFGAVRVDAGRERLVEWVREIQLYQRGRYVSEIGRFSGPPHIDDLSSLTLDEQDVKELRTCRPGRCGVKLSAGEIVTLRQDIAAAGSQWKNATQESFRRLLVARAVSYLGGGHAAHAPYNDHETVVSPAAEAAAVLAGLQAGPLLPAAAVQYLREFPKSRDDVDAFLYWSKETLGGGKPIVSITHVAIFPPVEDGRGPVVVSRQVYASHYLTGSLSVSLIAGSGAGGRYLLYARRSRTDVFEGAFGGLVRRVVSGRIRSDGPALLEELRRRLESGPPPAPSGS